MLVGRCSSKFSPGPLIWDEDRPDDDAEEHDYTAVWRSKPKSVGPNATFVEDDIEAVIAEDLIRLTYAPA
jgi:hypothetical protein